MSYGSLSHILSDKSSDIPPRMLSSILPHILSDLYSAILPDILSDIVSGIYYEISSDMYLSFQLALSYCIILLHIS